MTDTFLPLSGVIPNYPFEKLSDVAYLARYHLKKKNRTDEQVMSVQKLIFELMDVYFEDKRNEAISDLESEKMQEVRYAREYDYVDLYPFAVELSHYSDHWVFIGDDSDLGDIPTSENTDETEALYEILDWLPDNESEDGFIDAEPVEYFAALTLSLISDVIIMTNDKKSSVSTVSLSYIGDVLLKIGKSSGVMCELALEKKLEDKNSYLSSEIEELKVKLDELTGNQKKAEIKKKKNIDKAVNSRHKKNREAKSMVCEDWKVNKNNFKSAMKAAEHYAMWLEEKSYFFETITIRNWLYLYAKENNIKLS